MMIGISKERLEEVLSGNDEYKMPQPYINAQRKLLKAMIDCCEELNPFLPIDENTPKDCKVLLAFPTQDGSYEYAVDFAFEAATVRDFNAKGMPAIKPTHYQKIQAPTK